MAEDEKKEIPDVCKAVNMPSNPKWVREVCAFLPPRLYGDLEQLCKCVEAQKE